MLAKVFYPWILGILCQIKVVETQQNEQNELISDDRHIPVISNSLTQPRYDEASTTHFTEGHPFARTDHTAMAKFTNATNPLTESTSSVWEVLQKMLMPNVWFGALVTLVVIFIIFKCPKSGKCQRIQEIWEWIKNLSCFGKAEKHAYEPVNTTGRKEIPKPGQRNVNLGFLATDGVTQHPGDVTTVLELGEICEQVESKLEAEPLYNETRFYERQIEAVKRVFSSLGRTDVVFNKSFIKRFGRHFGLHEMSLTTCDEMSDDLIDFMYQVLILILNSHGSTLEPAKIIQFLEKNKQKLFAELLQNQLDQLRPL